MGKKIIYRKGNFQSMRDVYFSFRSLALEGKLPWKKRLNEKDIELIKNAKYSADWKVREAHDIWSIILRFEKDLRAYGVSCDIKTSKEQDSSTELKKTTSAPITRSNVIQYNGEKLIISFRFTRQLVELVKKEFKGVTRYNRENQWWEVPLDYSKEVKEFAETYNFQITDSARKAIDAFGNNFSQSYSAERVELELPLKLRLYDYQTVGADYCIRVMRSWLCDDMGLGKTPQAIATATGINRPPYLLICPKSLRFNWMKEIRTWTDYKPMVATNKNMAKVKAFIEHGYCDFLIMNYDSAKTYFVEEIKEIATKGGQKRSYIYLNDRHLLFNGVIIDEAHKLKNSKTLKFKIIKKMIQHMEYRQLLTGTPIVNKVDDAAAQLDLLGLLEPHFGSYNKFKKQYKHLNESSFNDSNNTARDLNTKLRTLCMIRREKYQVLTELPDKIRHIIPIEIDNQKEYDHAMINLQDYLASIKASNETIEASMKAEVLVRFNYLIQICSRGKIKAVCEWIKLMIDAGEKLVIFCWYRKTIELLIKEMKRIAPNEPSLEISGSVDDKTIEPSKELFQNDPKYKMIFITYSKGAEGLTLTASSNYLGFELSWTKAQQDQSEDRIHRIGQKNNANCHYPLAMGTIEERKYEIIQTKAAIMQKSVDATDVVKTNVQDELMKQIMNEQ